MRNFKTRDEGWCGHVRNTAEKLIRDVTGQSGNGTVNRRSLPPQPSTARGTLDQNLFVATFAGAVVRFSELSEL